MLKNSSILVWVFLLQYRAYIIAPSSFHYKFYIVSFLLKPYKRFCYADVHIVSLFQEVVNSSTQIIFQ